MQVQSVDFDFHLSMPESVLYKLFILNEYSKLTAVMIFVINKPLGSIVNKFLFQIPVPFFLGLFWYSYFTIVVLHHIFRGNLFFMDHWCPCSYSVE